MKPHWRMILAEREPGRDCPAVEIVAYEPATDDERIPELYARAFDEDPWHDDWNCFEEFDPEGAYVAVAPTGEGVGFILCFQRQDFGYISVLGVVPSWRRRGVASALIARACDHLRSRGLDTIKVDAFVDSPAAVRTYERNGFRRSELLGD